MIDLPQNNGNSWGKFSGLSVDEEKFFKATQLLWDYYHMRRRVERRQRARLKFEKPKIFLFKPILSAAPKTKLTGIVMSSNEPAD